MSQDGDGVKTEYKGPFKRIRRSDYKVVPGLKWQINKVLPVGATMMLHGDPKARKTFVALSMALSVSSGKSWCSLPVKQAETLYVSPEDHFGLIRRQVAWEALHNGGQQVPLDYFDAAVNLYDPQSVGKALGAIKAQGMRPRFMVLDTFQRSTVGADENSAKDMGKVFEILETFKRELGNPTILMPHHTNRHGSGYRGSSVIFGSVDGLLKLTKDDDYSVLKSEGVRMAADFPDITISFEQRPVMTEEGWYLELAVKDAATLIDKIAADGDDSDKARRIIVGECRKAGRLLHSHLEQACISAGLNKAKFDKELKYLSKKGRVLSTPDENDKRRHWYSLPNDDVYDMKAVNKGNEPGSLGISVFQYAPKGGHTENTHTELIPDSYQTHTQSDKTGTLGAVPPNQADDAVAFSALKQVSDGYTGISAEPDQQTGSEQVGPASAAGRVD